jgi:hypothetical protein
MRTLEENSMEQKRCRKAISDLESELRGLKDEKAAILYSEKFPAGKRVSYEGCEYEITGYCGKWVSIETRKIKKDGKLSGIIKHFYSWDIDNENVKLIGD